MIASGADASNPTAVVNCQDLRYRYFDIDPYTEKMFTERFGAYIEGFLEDEVLSTDQYDYGMGFGVRFMY